MTYITTEAVKKFMEKNKKLRYSEGVENGDYINVAFYDGAIFACSQLLEFEVEKKKKGGEK